MVVDVLGIDGAGAGLVVWVLGWFGDVAGFEVGVCFERGEGVGTGFRVEERAFRYEKSGREVGGERCHARGDES